MKLYQYRGVCMRIVDGDTMEIELDLGLNIKWRGNCRLAGINALELNSFNSVDRARAIAAKDWLVKNCPDWLLIDSIGLDKYGRPIVTIYDERSPGKSINEQMVELKLVDQYKK